MSNQKALLWYVIVTPIAVPILFVICGGTAILDSRYGTLILLLWSVVAIIWMAAVIKLLSQWWEKRR